MNPQSLKEIVLHFNLGAPLGPLVRVYGGLLHKMWRLDTNKGSYAIKQLSKAIDLKNVQIIENYELSEQIASTFISNSIPGISAILSTDDKYLFTNDDSGFLVYPWVNALPLSKDEINEEQTLTIAGILAKMHMMNLQFEKLGEAQFDMHQNQYIIDLVEKSIEKQMVFADSLNSNLSSLLDMNQHYCNSIEVLKKHTVIGHGDLDQKNVLWTEKKEPLLIDWESARQLNPTYEIVNVALDWSGITTINFNINLFHKILNSYADSGGIINKKTLNAAFYGVIGNWINWMVYNIHRSINSSDTEQINIGREQVLQVVPTKQLMIQLF